MKFGGKIHVHNCDWKNKFAFGSKRVNVKDKRGRKVERSKTLFAGSALSLSVFF